MINPSKILKVKGAMNTFKNNHPKFPKFLSAIHQKGLPTGTIIEINVTYEDGSFLSSNIKVTDSDRELLEELYELGKN